MNRINVFYSLFLAAATVMPAFTALADSVACNYTNPGESAEKIVQNAPPASEYVTEQNYMFKDLIERVRQGDRLAYNALAECYRYGKGGAEKCMFNAMLSYQLAGLKPDDLADMAFKANPNDELGLLNHFMVILDRQGLDSLGTVMKSMEIPDYGWADELKSIVGNANSDNLHEYILSLVEENSNGDEFLVAFASLFILNPHLPDLELLPEAQLMAEKVPFMYNLAGEKHWDRYREDKSKNKGNLDAALMYFQKADVNGFLTPQNARKILSFDARKDSDISKYFDKDDIARLIHIGGLDEKDIDGLDAVVPDMNPIEKISE